MALSSRGALLAQALGAALAGGQRPPGGDFGFGGGDPLLLRNDPHLAAGGASPARVPAIAHGGAIRVPGAPARAAARDAVRRRSLADRGDAERQKSGGPVDGAALSLPKRAGAPPAAAPPPTAAAGAVAPPAAALAPGPAPGRGDGLYCEAIYAGPVYSETVYSESVYSEPAYSSSACNVLGVRGGGSGSSEDGRSVSSNPAAINPASGAVFRSATVAGAGGRTAVEHGDATLGIPTVASASAGVYAQRPAPQETGPGEKPAPYADGAVEGSGNLYDTIESYVDSLFQGGNGGGHAGANRGVNGSGSSGGGGGGGFGGGGVDGEIYEAGNRSSLGTRSYYSESRSGPPRTRSKSLTRVSLRGNEPQQPRLSPDENARRQQQRQEQQQRQRQRQQQQEFFIRQQYELEEQNRQLRLGLERERDEARRTQTLQLQEMHRLRHQLDLMRREDARQLQLREKAQREMREELARQRMREEQRAQRELAQAQAQAQQRELVQAQERELAQQRELAHHRAQQEHAQQVLLQQQLQQELLERLQPQKQAQWRAQMHALPSPSAENSRSPWATRAEVSQLPVFSSPSSSNWTTKEALGTNLAKLAKLTEEGFISAFYFNIWTGNVAMATLLGEYEMFSLSRAREPTAILFRTLRCLAPPQADFCAAEPLSGTAFLVTGRHERSSPHTLLEVLTLLYREAWNLEIAWLAICAALVQEHSERVQSGPPKTAAEKARREASMQDIFLLALSTCYAQLFFDHCFTRFLLPDRNVPDDICAYFDGATDPTPEPTACAVQFVLLLRERLVTRADKPSPLTANEILAFEKRVVKGRFSPFVSRLASWRAALEAGATAA